MFRDTSIAVRICHATLTEVTSIFTLLVQLREETDLQHLSRSLH